jgi:hypothetical protein
MSHLVELSFNKSEQHSFEDKFLIMFNSEVRKNFFSA